MEVNGKSWGSHMQQANILYLFPEMAKPEVKQAVKRLPKCKPNFNFDEMKWEGITVEQVKFWEECFPLVDVVDELTKKMPAWLDGNPEKSHKKRWKAFISGWLSRAQSRYEQFKGR